MAETLPTREFLATSDGLALVKAFIRIGDAKLRCLDDRFHESCHKRGIHLGFRTPI
jgi:hypothetical protein